MYVERRIEDVHVRIWMETNLLELNDEKTEFIIIIIIRTFGNLNKMSEKIVITIFQTCYNDFQIRYNDFQTRYNDL